MGRLLPPVDVNSEDKLSELNKRISIGPVTLVFVYADWCGHCKHFKPEMDKLEASPDRSIQTARIRDDMLPRSALNKMKINGYPSLMLIKKNGKAALFKDKTGEVTNAIPEHNDINKMMTIVRSAGTPEGMSLLTGQSPNTAETLEELNTLENASGNNLENASGNNLETLENASGNNLETLENASGNNLVTLENASGNNLETLENASGNNLETLENASGNNLVTLENASGNNLENASGNNLETLENNSEKSIVADRLSPRNAAMLQKTMSGGSRRRMRSMSGGGLWSHLLSASQHLAPAASLFLASSIVNSRKRKGKGKKKTRRSRK